MTAILHHRSQESTPFLFKSISLIKFWAYCLYFTGFIFYRQRMSAMNILELIKRNIIKDFPQITESELQERLLIAERALKHLFN